MKQLSNKVILGTLILVLLMSLTGCSRNEGTGLSENETYLGLLSTDEPLGIVLLGDYYLLPEPLYRFLENGWQVAGGGSLRFEAIDVLTLPAGTTMQVVLEQENMRLYLDVSNAGHGDVPLLDATVSQLRTGDAEKDQAVIVGGVTIHTSGEDATDRLQSLDISHSGGGSGRQSSIRISDEAHFGGQMWVRVDDHTVHSFSVELGEQYHWESLTLIFPDTSDEATEAWFMSTSYYFEGTVIGIYYIGSPSWWDDDTMVTSGETIVARDSAGNLFATLRDPRIDLERIQNGDTIQVYYGFTAHRGSNHELIEYIDGSRIPYVRAEVLVINGEVHHSNFTG